MNCCQFFQIQRFDICLFHSSSVDTSSVSSSLRSLAMKKPSISWIPGSSCRYPPCVVLLCNASRIVGIDAFQPEGIIFQKPFEIVLVLISRRSCRCCKSVRRPASHMSSTTDRICRCSGTSIPAASGCHFVFDIRLSADDAKTGAGNIRQYRYPPC